MFQGLIPLALDLLISKYAPWYSPGTILLKNPYMQDSIIQLYPWKHYVFESFRQGIIPFWNPYQMMGAPFMASLKPMIFYPLNFLYLFGEVNAWNSLLFLQILMSLFFSYFLARDFKLGPFPSILVSLAFSLNSLMMGVLQFGSEGHVLLWFPLFLFASKRYLEEQKGRYLGLLSIVIAFSIFAGQLQYTGYLLVVTVAFIIYYGIYLKANFKIYALLILSIILGIGISSIQLLPSLELFSKSFRGASSSYEIFSRGLMTPDKLLRLFAPDYFGNPVSGDLGIGYIEASGYFGIIPLFFTIYAAIFGKKSLFVRFFTWVCLIAALFSLQGIGQILYFLHIPLLTSGEANRIFSLVLFSGAILSGFGLSLFLHENSKKNLVRLGGFAIIALIAFGLGTLIHFPTHTVKGFITNIRFPILILTLFIVPTGIYLLVNRRNKFLIYAFLSILIFVTFFDFYRMGYRFLTFSNPRFLYPSLGVTQYSQKQSDLTLARVQHLTEPELPTYLRVQSIETYNPLYLKRSGELLQALQEKPISNLPINKYQISPSLTSKYAFDFLGVSLVAVEKDVNPSVALFNTAEYQNTFTPVYRDERFIVYKNSDGFPRYDLFYNYLTVTNDKKILSLIAERKIDFRNTVLLEENLPIKLEKGSGSAILLFNKPNELTFVVNSDKPALFYISDTYFPGWNASINDKKTKIYRANYNLRAVLIPTGKSILQFSYIPTYYFLGLFMSLGSALTLLALIIFQNKTLKQKIIPRKNTSKSK